MKTKNIQSFDEFSLNENLGIFLQKGILGEIEKLSNKEYEEFISSIFHVDVSEKGSTKKIMTKIMSLLTDKDEAKTILNRIKDSKYKDIVEPFKG